MSYPGPFSLLQFCQKCNHLISWRYSDSQDIFQDLEHGGVNQPLGVPSLLLFLSPSLSSLLSLLSPWSRGGGCCAKAGGHTPLEGCVGNSLVIRYHKFHRNQNNWGVSHVWWTSQKHNGSCSNDAIMSLINRKYTTHNLCRSATGDIAHLKQQIPELQFMLRSTLMRMTCSTTKITNTDFYFWKRAFPFSKHVLASF